MKLGNPTMCYYLEPVSLDDGLSSAGLSPFWGGGSVGTRASVPEEPDAQAKADGNDENASRADAGEKDIALPAPDEIAPRARARWDKAVTRRTLSNMLRHMRQVRGLSQMDVAKRLSTTQPDIARMESATGPWPSQDKIAAFSEACNFIAGLCFFDAGDDSEAITEEGPDVGATSDFVFLPLGKPSTLSHPGLLGRFGLELGDVYEIVAEPMADVPEGGQ